MGFEIDSSCIAAEHTSPHEDCFVHQRFFSRCRACIFIGKQCKEQAVRSCLGAPMLDALCLIASEGPAEDDFEYEEAVEFWHGKKDRRVSLFVKAKHAGRPHSSVSNSRTNTRR